jgi:hypothetical protein
MWVVKATPHNIIHLLTFLINPVENAASMYDIKKENEKTRGVPLETKTYVK